MPTIDTKDFFSKIVCNEQCVVRIIGIQNGSFILLADYSGETYINSNKKGKHIEYKNVEDILHLIKTETFRNEISIDIKLWNS